MNHAASQPKCPVCNDWHTAYALFRPACDYPGNRYVRFTRVPDSPSEPDGSRSTDGGLTISTSR
jgi:hypothetical protein